MSLTAYMTRDPSQRVEIRSVPLGRPLDWLRRGKQDFNACWPANIFHGVLIAALGWVLLMMLGNHPYFVAAAVSGFLLLAPIMCTGLCELSRRLEAHEALGFDESVEPIRRHGLELVRYGGLLVLVVVAWFMIAELTLRNVFDLGAPSVAESYYRGFIDVANLGQVLAFVAAGAVLAALVLSVSVVTVPLIIDRNMSAREAMLASMRVVAANPGALLVWSALIVVITAFGFATLMIFMAILIPWLGHATWHAYRDLVR